MNHSNHLLNDLVAIARDGKDFYEHAATKVADPELKAMFTRIAGVKTEIVASLSKEVRATGDKPAESGTIVGEIGKLYGDVRASLGGKDYAYVAQLEQGEDRLLKAFEDAIKSPDLAPAAVTVLTGLLPEVRKCHDQMRNRKLALKKAA